MKHFNKLFSGIVAGITVAVLGVTSIPTNAALSQSIQDFWDSFKTYTDVNMSGAFDALTDAINYSTTVSRRIWGNDGGHGGGSHSRSGAITTFVDSPAAVFNSDGFADAAAALLVPYAKASTGKDGITNVITEVTVPQQYDFTGMCSFHNSINTPCTIYIKSSVEPQTITGNVSIISIKCRGKSRINIDCLSLDYSCIVNSGKIGGAIRKKVLGITIPIEFNMNLE